MATTNNVVQMASAAAVAARISGSRSALLRQRLHGGVGGSGAESSVSTVGDLRVTGPSAIRLVAWAVGSLVALVTTATVLLDVGFHAKLMALVAIAGLPFVALVLMAVNEGARHKQVAAYRAMLGLASDDQLKVSRLSNLSIDGRIEVENELRRRAAGRSKE